MTARRHTPLPQDENEPISCSPDLRLTILHGLPFFAGLQHEEVEAINRRFQDRGFEPGETLVHAGDEAGYLFVLAAGKARVSRPTLAGKEVLLDVLTPGEFFGPLVPGEDTYPDTVRALTVVCALAISSAEFRDILNTHPQAAVAALDMTASRLQAAYKQVHQLSAYPAEARIAAALLTLGEKLGRKSSEGLLIGIPLSRENLADMTGTTTETASRVLSAFQKDGLVKAGRGWVALADLARLRELLEDF